MVLYLIIGAIAISISSALGFTIGVTNIVVSHLEVFLQIIITFFTLLILDIIFAFMIRWFPKKWVNPFNKIYKVHNWEKKFYVKLGVRKWKDLIPESGKALVGFDKRNVAAMNDNEYLKKFMEESVIAELMHIISFVVSAILLFIPFRLAIIVRLPIILANMIFQIMPVFVQRYNRPKLMLAYERNIRLQQRKQKNEEIKG